MSSGNGHDPHVVLTDGGRMVPPQSSAELSARERSKLTDAMVAQISTLTTQVATLTTDIGDLAHLYNALLSQHAETAHTLRELEARFVGQRGFKARLRWLLVGA